MSVYPGPFYLFASAAQWAAARRGGLPAEAVLEAGSGIDERRLGGCPVAALALGEDGEPVWADTRGRLFAICLPGPELGQVRRLVAGCGHLWALAGGMLIQLDAATLHILVAIESEETTDVAEDGHGGLWRLAPSWLDRLDDAGRVTCRHAIEGAVIAIAGAGGRLALLRQGPNRLEVIDESGMGLEIDLEEEAGPGWGGRDLTLSGSPSGFLLFDESDGAFARIGVDGGLVARGSWRNGSPPTQLIAVGDDLLAVFAHGDGAVLRRFPGAAGGAGERIMTPALETESPAGTWLRAEVTARLPEGATLSLRWASTRDDTLRWTVGQRLADESRPVPHRLREADSLLGSTWFESSFTYVGERADGQAPVERFSFPLHQAHGPILWIELRLSRNGATARGEIESLIVLHEARSLMDDLPAIYAGSGDGDGTMRRLVGVLEATTQGIDHRIGRLARRLDPERTTERWLPNLAAMLGLPFHESLSPAMQRGLVSAAAPILTRRGTRAGLIAMLEALFPNRPIRVTDRTARLALLSLGGGGVAGGALPALLGGPSARVPRLNARLVLNRTALCPADPCADGLISAAPEVAVTIPATLGERRRYAAAVVEMIEAMLPAGVLLRLRWVPWRPRTRSPPADVLAIVSGPEPLRLGAGQALGAVTLGGRQVGHIDRGGYAAGPRRLL